MAVNRRRKKEPWLTAGDVRLLLCAAVFLGAVVLRYGSAPQVAGLRTRVQTLLTGENGIGAVVEAFGGARDREDTPEDGTLAVDAPAQPDSTAVFSPEDTLAQTLAASSGTADDVTERRKTRYPDTVDNTLYVMAFAHQKPIEGRVTSPFGAREDPLDEASAFHYGLDIAAPEGTAIGALADGEVLETGVNASYGNYVVVGHEDGFTSLYAHCSAVTAEAGARVKMGEQVAAVGSTGRSTGNHLHLEIWRNGHAVDPSRFVTYA